MNRLDCQNKKGANSRRNQRTYFEDPFKRYWFPKTEWEVRGIISVSSNNLFRPRLVKENELVDIKKKVKNYEED